MIKQSNTLTDQRGKPRQSRPAQEKRKQWHVQYHSNLSKKQIKSHLQRAQSDHKRPLSEYLEGALIDEEKKELFFYLSQQREKSWFSSYPYLVPNTLKKWESGRKSWKACKRDSNLQILKFGKKGSHKSEEECRKEDERVQDFEDIAQPCDKYGSKLKIKQEKKALEKQNIALNSKHFQENPVSFFYGEIGKVRKFLDLLEESIQEGDEDPQQVFVEIKKSLKVLELEVKKIKSRKSQSAPKTSSKRKYGDLSIHEQNISLYNSQKRPSEGVCSEDVNHSHEEKCGKESLLGESIEEKLEGIEYASELNNRGEKYLSAEKDKRFESNFMKYKTPKKKLDKSFNKTSKNEENLSKPPIVRKSFNIQPKEIDRELVIIEDYTPPAKYFPPKYISVDPNIFFIGFVDPKTNKIFSNESQF